MRDSSNSSIFTLQCVKKALHPIFVNNEDQENCAPNTPSRDHPNVNQTFDEDQVKQQRLIQTIRGQVMSRSAEAADDYYSEDLERIRNSDWAVMRFISSEDSHEPAEKISESIDHCLKWRKEYGIREIRIASFPSEFFEIGLFELGTSPENGKSVIYIRGNKYKKLSELTEHFERFGSCLYETLDSSLVNADHRLTAFLDLKGVTLDSVDVPIFRHFLELMFNYFPNMLHEAFVVDVSWFLRPIVFLLLKVVPDRFSKVVRFVSRKDLSHTSDPSIVPRELGGSLLTQPLQPLGEEKISLQDYVDIHDIPQHVVSKAKKIYKL